MSANLRVDVPATFVETPSLLRFLDLTNVLGRQVDLVMRTALKPRLRDRVLAAPIVS